jgi:hypothetical protein
MLVPPILMQQLQLPTPNAKASLLVRLVQAQSITDRREDEICIVPLQHYREVSELGCLDDVLAGIYE